MLDRLRSWLNSLSVSTRTSLGLAMGLAIIIIAMAALAFGEERGKAIDESLTRLDQHNREIARAQEMRFERIKRTQLRARELFAAERAALDSATAQTLLDQLYPVQPDGTRRSTAAMFEGGIGPLGLTQGMAAFIPAGVDRDPEAVGDLIAATRTVRALAEGNRSELESLYYFTPANAIVIFAPQREDRLTFYRRTAPATLDFQDRDFAKVSRPAINPARVMLCTSLQPLIAFKDKQIWTTGCLTPVDRDEQHVGTFGTSVPLHELIEPTRYSHAKGEQIAIVSGDGRLIHHPRYTVQNDAATSQFLDLKTAREPELKALWQIVQASGARGFTGHVPSLNAFVSLRALPSAGWYALAVQPERSILDQAFRPVRRIAVTALITLGLSVLIVTVLLRQLVGRPLGKLARDAQRITDELAGDQMIAQPGPETTGNEVTQLVEQFETMASAVRRSHATLEQRVQERTLALNDANAQLRTLAELDPLTGIANRRKIMADLEARLGKLRDGSALALLLLDVDNFKAINDNHGHVAGDDALRSLADRIQGQLRAGDALGRMGGEEFLIILDRARPIVADAIAERIRAAVANARFDLHDSLSLSITVSIGAASWHPDDTVKTLYAKADQALYEAKSKGRNCVITSGAADRSTRSAA